MRRCHPGDALKPGWQVLRRRSARDRRATHSHPSTYWHGTCFFNPGDFTPDRRRPMAKRNTSNKNAGQTTGGAAGSTSASESAEDRVIALAEQLGRIVGTIQAKAGGLLDRDALMQQISQVR